MRSEEDKLHLLIKNESKHYVYEKTASIISEKKDDLTFFQNILTILAVFILLTEALYAQELPRRVQIGVAMQPVENGVVVTFAPENQPAAMAGIREGDIIRSMNGVPVSSQWDVIEKLRNELPASRWPTGLNARRGSRWVSFVVYVVVIIILNYRVVLLRQGYPF